MFLKQYNYKPRSGSVGSQGSQDGQAQQAAQQSSQPAAASSPPKDTNISSAIAGRRRSSAAGGQFAGLQGYKRSEDTKAAGFAEQHQQGGVLGQMWNNFTKGTGK